jgi:hypothetical protein
VKATPQQIDVRRYDVVVELLSRRPQLSFDEVADRANVATSTVRRIWEGDISRPAAIVLERLMKPRRCGECGALCVDWPCVTCSIHRRKSAAGFGPSPLRFVYKHQSK